MGLGWALGVTVAVGVVLGALVEDAGLLGLTTCSWELDWDAPQALRNKSAARLPRAAILGDLIIGCLHPGLQGDVSAVHALGILGLAAETRAFVGDVVNHIE